MKQIKINPVERIVAPVNHVFTVDISGSMYNTLPKIRSHLKAKLNHLVKDDDTVSIVYFADSRCCGVAVDKAVVNDSQSFLEVCSAIDRHLTPRGCTSFVPPLEKAIEIVESADNGKINNFIFMTDGYDNCNTTSSILEATNRLPSVFSGIAIIEYGWYCNRELLTKMAEMVGAIHIFTETYEEFEPVVESLLSNQTVTKIPVEVGTKHAIYIDSNRVVVVSTNDDGVALVPETTSIVYAPTESVSPNADVEGLYVAVYYGVFLGNSDLVWAALKQLGDVALIKAYTNCFTKQDYSNFNESVSNCIVDPSARFVDGINYSMVPDENATTVIDVLTALQAGDNELDLEHPDFEYNRIGKARVQKDDDTIEQLKQQLLVETDTTKIVEIANEITKYEQWTPVFASSVTKVPMNSLVFNESRPNISINTSQTGTIAIPDSKQSEFGLPPKIQSQIYRNYTVVKDGIINMKLLPVRLDLETFTKLKEWDLVTGNYDPVRVYVIDLTKTPLINRSMVKNTSIVELFTKSLQLEELGAQQKVLGSLLGTSGNRVGLAEKYGVDAANFLSEAGIRDYGFSPKTTSVESTDVYLSRELSVKISGLSALPSIKAVKDKIAANKKLNAGDYLMKKYIDMYAYITDPTPEILQVIEVDKAACVKQIRQLRRDISAIIYSIVVGKKWFTDTNGIEDFTREIELDGFGKVSCKAVLEEKEVKI